MFENFFGRSKSESGYNNEAMDASQEANALTGRENMEMSDDIGTHVEDGAATPEERSARVADAIEEIKGAYGIADTELLGMQKFFVAELQKRGVLTARDMQFDAEGMVQDVLEQKARKVA